MKAHLTSPGGNQAGVETRIIIGRKDDGIAWQIGGEPTREACSNQKLRGISLGQGNS
jgi:hypothetical protein